MSGRELHWRVGDQDISCRIEESKGHGTLHLSGTALSFRRFAPAHIEISGKRHRFYVVHKRNVTTVWLDGRTYRLQHGGKLEDSQSTSHTGIGEVRSLMPGKLIRLMVGTGDTVSERQTVAIMESMKMESPLLAPKSGRVSEIRYAPGEVLDMGEVIMIIEA